MITPKQMARFSALLWGLAALIGVLVIVLPHGRRVDLTGWIALVVFAVLVALWIAWMGERQPMWGNYVLSVVAVMAVSAAVAAGQRSPVSYALVLCTFCRRSSQRRSIQAAPLSPIFWLRARSLPLHYSPPDYQERPRHGSRLMGTTTTAGLVVHVLQRALNLAATTDPLTGLVNRRAFEPVLDRELARCERLGHTLSLVVIDLDDFKAVNDDLGHQEGDRALVEVTRAWSKELRTADVLARAGGDEFVLLLPSTGEIHAMEVLARLTSSSSQSFSAGVTVAAPGSNPDEVMRRADDALLWRQASRPGEGGHLGGP